MKIKSNVLTLIMALMAVIGMYAQEMPCKFKGAALYNAKGDVKVIKIKTKNPVAVNKKEKFNQEGKINCSLLTYNEQGLPTAMDLTMGSRGIVLRADYTPEENIADVSYECNILGAKSNFSVAYTYDGEGNQTQAVITVKSKKGNGTITSRYSDYVFDDKGNWISRQVEETSIGTDGKEKKAEYVETREIKYW